MKNKKIIISIIVILVGIIFIFGYFKNINLPNEEKIYNAKIGIYNGEASILMIIANKNGYLKDENLNIEFKYYPSGFHAMQAMLKGEVNYSNSAEFVALKNSFSNSNFKILASMSEASVNGMIGKKSKEIFNPSDIKGKRIGTSLGTAAEHYVGVFLKQHGLVLNDISLIDVHPKKLHDALSKDEVDAVFSWEPNIYNILEKDKSNNLSYFSMPVGFPFYFLFTVDSAFHSKNQIISTKILRALYKAEEYKDNHPLKVKEMIKNQFKYDDKYIEYSLKKHIFELSFPYTLLTLLENEADWLRDNNLVDKKTIEYNTIIDTRPLKSVSPTSVTIIE